MALNTAHLRHLAERICADATIGNGTIAKAISDAADEIDALRAAPPTTKPSGEAVAWRYRRRILGGFNEPTPNWGDWHYVGYRPQGPASDILLIEPLYASTQPSTKEPVTPLERYALTVLDAHRGSIGDLDGGFLQSKAEACGLLYCVEVAEPCGDHCPCAEYGDFPQQCLRLKPELEPKMAEHRKEPK